MGKNSTSTSYNPTYSMNHSSETSSIATSGSKLKGETGSIRQFFPRRRNVFSYVSAKVKRLMTIKKTRSFRIRRHSLSARNPITNPPIERKRSRLRSIYELRHRSFRNDIEITDLNEPPVRLWDGDDEELAESIVAARKVIEKSRTIPSELAGIEYFRNEGLSVGIEEALSLSLSLTFPQMRVVSGNPSIKRRKSSIRRVSSFRRFIRPPRATTPATSVIMEEPKPEPKLLTRVKSLTKPSRTSSKNLGPKRLQHKVQYRTYLRGFEAPIEEIKTNIQQNTNELKYGLIPEIEVENQQPKSLLKSIIQQNIDSTNKGNVRFEEPRMRYQSDMIANHNIMKKNIDVMSEDTAITSGTDLIRRLSEKSNFNSNLNRLILSRSSPEMSHKFPGLDNKSLDVFQYEQQLKLCRHDSGSINSIPIAMVDPVIHSDIGDYFTNIPTINDAVSTWEYNFQQEYGRS